MKATVLIALLVMAGPLRGVAQEPPWYQLYDEAIKHAQQGEYEQAEAKLLRAQKEGPASGRSVFRYGSIREPYFPEYYLGIVYVSTGRPKEALAMFQRARAAKIDTRAADFRAITTFEGQAKAALSRGTVATNKEPEKPPAKPGGDTPTPGNKPEVPTGPAVPAPDYVRQFADLLATAKTQLSQRSFDVSEQAATSARDLAIKHNLTERPQADALLKQISGARFAARVEDALDRRDAATARRELNVLTAAVPDYRADPLRDRVDVLERELRTSTLQRDAMRSFFGGNYEQAVQLLEQSATVAPLTPRGHFYRACSLAALAAASPNPARDRRLDEARRSYAVAAAGASQFRDDLRYISPKVKQLLGIK